MKRQIHMMMVYVCSNCGEVKQIWLERGLEEEANNKLRVPSGLPHKPVPFGIKCPKCGENTMTHTFGCDVCSSYFLDAPDGINLFANEEEYDYGKVIFDYKSEE